MSIQLKKLFLPGVFLFGVTLFNCAELQQLASIQKPKLNVEKVRVTDMTFNSADLAFDVKINNPNPLSVQLAGFDYDFLLEGTSFLKGEQNSQLNITANGESKIQIPLTLQFKELYKSYQALKNRDSTAYQLKCGLRFNLPVLGKVKIPVSKKGHLPLVKLPSVKDFSLKLKKITFTRADLELKLNVDNPNAFNLLLNKLNYDFVVNGLSWAKGTTNKSIRVTEKGKSAINIPVSLNFLQVGKSVYSAITKGQPLNYNFNGNLDLNTSIPVFKHASLPISKSGQVNIVR